MPEDARTEPKPMAFPPPDSPPEDELPERLGERIDPGSAGIASGEPDLLPDVEPPDGQM